MRKILYIIPLVMGCMMISCAKGKSAEELASDSARRADSIAQVEKAAAEAAAARADSIRQDSIAKAEELKAHIPTFKQIHSVIVTNGIGYDGYKALFTRLGGYKFSHKMGETWDPGEDRIMKVKRLIATLNEGGTPSVKFVEEDWGYTITITGFDERLNEIETGERKDIKEFPREIVEDCDWKVTRLGNTVKVYTPACFE